MGRYWNWYWYGPVAAVRPYIITRSILLVFAFDAWTRSLRTAARYGSGDFNVAHFSWLDAVQPLPTASVRVGVLVSTGLLAMTIVCGGGGRLLLAALALIHTYGWSMSMFDSFQHHYFLSLTLLCLVFFPSIHGRDLARQPAETPDGTDHPDRRAGPSTSAWAYVLLGVTVAIVYAFAAVPKLEYEWSSGQTFRSIAGTQILDPLAELGAGLGISQGWFWLVIASSVAVLELLLAVGYLAAVRQDSMTARQARLIGGSAWALAMLLHLGAEMIQLHIGWFSYYMLVLACGFLLPVQWLRPIVRIIIWVPTRCAAGLERIQQGVSPTMQSVVTTGLALGVGCTAAFVGTRLDLPGSTIVCASIGIALAVGTFFTSRRAGQLAAQRYAIAGLLAAGVLWAAIARSDVRYDYYRYLGYDLEARGTPRAALTAYLQAERYAPAGESRGDRIDALRQNIGAME
jgi:hypothetical protein